MTGSTIGASVPRHDLAEKLTGQARYTGDIKLPGMLHGRILRSLHPHARILSVDTSEVTTLPGVLAVVTPFDAPNGRLAEDTAILDTEVRFIGDEVAAIAAEEEDIAQEAIELIQVEYQPLPFVTDPQEAMRSRAPAVHPGGNLVGGEPLVLTRGDVKEGLAEADLTFEDTFSTPSHSGAALEPRAAIASWEEDRLTVWKCSRGVYMDQSSISQALGLPVEKVRVIGPPLGAGYGNKDETRLAVLTAILARRAQRPVRIEFTREEEFVAGRSRHATVTTLKVGVKKGGEITAIHATTIMDTGAYLSSGPGVIRRAGQGALYLYRCPNVRYDGYLVYTNKPSAGSYRALGAPQGHFALEVMMDRVAEELGIDPLEFRLKNHVGIEGQPGHRVTPPDEIIDTQPVEGGVPFSSNGLRECLIKGSEAIGWRKRRHHPGTQEGARKTGIGMSMFIYRGGPGWSASAKLRLNRDGTVQLISGLMDVGEGSATVLSQIVAETLGIPYDRVQTTFADTLNTPEAPITAGSTATFSMGLAAQEAANRLKAKISDLESSHTDQDLSLSDVAQLTGDVPLEAEATITPGNTDYIVNSFGAHFAKVEVDTETGEVRVLRYVAAHDSGRIINPNLAISQVEGGISQMLGFTLTEEMLIDSRNGATLNASFLEHKGPGIQDFPPIQVIFVDVVDPVGPFGAKALGEPPSIGVAPAIVNAIYNATGIQMSHLPVSQDRILNHLASNEESRAP